MLCYNRIKSDRRSRMDKELKEILDSILNRIDRPDKRLEVVEYKTDRTNTRFDNLDLKIDNLDLRIRNTEANIRKDIKKLSDENETMIEVLKQREILPR